jgi:hypothetical protein
MQKNILGYKIHLTDKLFMMQSVIGCLPINYSTSSETTYQSGGSYSPGCSFASTPPSCKSPLSILLSEIESFHCSSTAHIRGYSSVFTLLASYSNYVIGEISILSKGGFSRAVSLGTTDGLSLSSSTVWCSYQPVIVPVGTITLGRILSVIGTVLDDWGELNPNSNQEPAPTRLLTQSWSASGSSSRLSYSGNVSVCVGETYNSNNYLSDSSTGDSLVFDFCTKGKSSTSPAYIENFAHIHSNTRESPVDESDK